MSDARSDRSGRVGWFWGACAFRSAFLAHRKWRGGMRPKRGHAAPLGLLMQLGITMATILSRQVSSALTRMFDKT